MLKKSLSKSTLMTALITGSVIWGGYTVGHAEEQQSFFLDEMVVTASRTEQKEFDTQSDITVITRKDLEEKHYTDLGDALKDVPGVNLQNYGASGENYTSNRLYINGSSNIVVLIDGMRSNVNGSVSSVLSPSEFSNLDTVERIEVLKGSASILYGSDAVGGVINIITRKDNKTGVKTSVSAIGGSYGKQTYRFMNRGYQDGLFWMASAQQNKMNDFKDGRGNKVIHGVDSKTYDIQLGKKFDENSEITFRYNKYKSDYERPANGGLRETIRQYGQKDNEKFSFQWNRNFNENLTNMVSLYRNNNKLKDNYKDLSKIWLMDLSTIGFTDQITYKNKNNTLIAGFDFYQDRVNDYSSTSTTTQGTQTDKYSGKHLTNRAYFLQDNFKFGKNWNITPGIRYTSTSQFGSNTSKSVTLGYNDGKSNIYTSYKEFFVSPNQYQLYSKYGGSGLKPSEGRTIELGVNHNFTDDFIGTLNIYKTKADNMIAFGNDSKYHNISNETTYGWSVGLKKLFSDKFSTNVNYTNIRIPAVSASQNENRDGYLPKGEFNIGFDYTLEKFNTNLTTRGIINRPGRKVNEGKVPNNLKTFWLFDLAMNYKANKNIKGFIKINNLFDKFYTDQLYNMDPDGSWYSAPGRNFQIGMEYTF